MSNDYPEPVSKLLTYGDARLHDWPDYLELGLTQEHIPDLIRMATDDALNAADTGSREVWAPTHAWRALAQLRAEQAIHPLMALFGGDDDWATSELPDVYAMIGPAAIPALAEYVDTGEHDTFARLTAGNCLERIGRRNPEAREACIAALQQPLERCEQNEPHLNGFLISDLLDLKAVDAMPVIRAAYEKRCVDVTIAGDLEDIEIDLGLRAVRSTPRPHLGLLGGVVPHPSGLFSDLTPGKSPKVGRNDPCPCGSGKKYKKCCLNK